MMTSGPLPMTRRAGFSLLASMCALATVGLSLGEAQPTPSPKPSRPTTHTDDELRTMVLGRWRTESNGTRVVDNRPDGTASMDVTFDFIASLLYGSQMKLELTWFVKEGALIYQIKSGSPEASVKSIIDTYGRQASYHFKSIQHSQMHLVRIIDPTETYLWVRVD